MTTTCKPDCWYRKFERTQRAQLEGVDLSQEEVEAFEFNIAFVHGLHDAMLEDLTRAAGRAFNKRIPVVDGWFLHVYDRGISPTYNANLYKAHKAEHKGYPLSPTVEREHLTPAEVAEFFVTSVHCVMQLEAENAGS